MQPVCHVSRSVPDSAEPQSFHGRQCCGLSGREDTVSTRLGVSRGCRSDSMNINALLSPESSPRTPSSSSASNESSSPRKARPAGGKRTTSGLSQEITRSPDRYASTSTSRPSSGYGTSGWSQQAFPLHTVTETAPNSRPLQAPTSSPSSGGHVRNTSGPEFAPRASSSTPQMEALAGKYFMSQDRT